MLPRDVAARWNITSINRNNDRTDYRRHVDFDVAFAKGKSKSIPRALTSRMRPDLLFPCAVKRRALA